MSSQRRERIALSIIAVVGLFVGLAWVAVMFLRFHQGEIVDGEMVYVYGDLWGYDFEAYANAAVRLVNEGSLYQAETLAGPFRPGPYGLYLYSPVLGVSLLPVAGMAIADSSIIWFGLRVIAMVVACGLMPVKPIVRVFAFVVATFSLAVIEDLVLGNVSVLLLLPLVVAWRWLDEPIGAIAQALAISVRPMLGILIVWQLLRRRWRAVAWTLAAGLVLMLLSLPFVGVGGYTDYITVLTNAGGFSGQHENRDIASTVLGLGADETVATLALFGGYAVAIAAMLLSLRRDPDIGFVVTVTASLLLSPLLWDHYLAMLVLPAAFLADRVRPVFILLPLLAWLPADFLPLVVVLAMLLPFLARDRAVTRPASPDTSGPSPGSQMASA